MKLCDIVEAKLLVENIQFLQSLEDAGITVEKNNGDNSIWVFLKPSMDELGVEPFTEYLKKLRATVGDGYEPDTDVTWSYDTDDDEVPAALIFHDPSVLAFRGVQDFLLANGGKK